MIAATVGQFEVRRRLNRFNTDYEKKLTVPIIDSIINEAIELVFQQSVIVYEVRDDIALNIDTLVKRGVELNFNKVKTKVQAKFKDKHYKILRLVVEATNKNCKDNKSLIVRLFQSQKLSEGLKSPYWKPSYEWEETIGIINNNELIDIYDNEEIEIKKVIIDYIEKHPIYATPSLSENGFYVNSGGETVSKDQGLILDEVQARKIWDVAALIGLRDLGATNDFQAELNKILFSNTHFLTFKQ